VINPSFRSTFEQATGNPLPLPYQERLAVGEPFPALLDVPTGLGKTAAAILAWVWRRRFADGAVRARTPRRLVYCLPMRVLVEQTFTEAVKWVDRLGLLAGEAEWSERDSKGLPTKLAQLVRSDRGKERGYSPNPDAGNVHGWAASHGNRGQCPIAIHLLLGGEERTDWAMWPERDAILIGTQDMLLSRALNRGYAAGRARWPLEFGLLNNDCLWVFDEIQLMDTGLASSLQLDAWRGSLCLRPSCRDFAKPTENHVAKPCHSLWMSATMAQHWLDSAIDRSPRTETEWSRRHQLNETERTDERLRSGQLFEIKKELLQAPIDRLEKPKTKDGKPDRADAERKQENYLKALAEHIGNADDHTRTGLTLVIINTVDRATRLYELLQKQSNLSQVPIRLIHSRFRPYEREQWAEFLTQKDSASRIIVSTQVVEAGVDLSACVLYTELAPWASLVQRFGRCARYPGESGKVIWLDLDLGTEKQPVDHWARPYDRTQLVAACQMLRKLQDVGLKSLTVKKEEIERETASLKAKALFPYAPRFVPRDKDLFDLFDTTPDLTGADVDISRYIRDGEELDVQVFWRQLPDGEEPTKKDRPDRRELCPVPFHRFREQFVALRKAGRIYRRLYRTGWEQMVSPQAEEIYPGQVFLLQKSCGGYSTWLGWTGNPAHTDFELPARGEPTRSTAQDEEEDAEDLSQISKWLTVLEHTRDVCGKLDEILGFIDLAESDRRILRPAARWHDRGKAHREFQAKLKDEVIQCEEVRCRLDGQPAAKAPDPAWKKNGRRPGFRHELASALAILETLRSREPTHEAFAWPEGLDMSEFGGEGKISSAATGANDALVEELLGMSSEDVDLLVYLVAAHHGKVRMSLRSSPDDERSDVDDPCPGDKRQARGVRDGDELPACQIPGSDQFAGGVQAPTVTLSLDMMELGLSARYGASWRERMQMLLERFGPFRLAYLEALLRAADCRASADEDHPLAQPPK